MPIFIGTAMAFSDGIANLESALLVFIGVLMFHRGIILPKKAKFLKILFYISSLPIILFFQIGRGELIAMIGYFILLIAISHALYGKDIRIPVLKGILIFISGPGLLCFTYYIQSFEMNLAVALSGIAPGLFALSLSLLKRTGLSSETKFIKIIYGLYLFCLFQAAILPTIIYFITHDHIYTLFAVFVILFTIPIIIFPPPANERYFYRGQNITLLIAIAYTIIFSIGWLF